MDVARAFGVRRRSRTRRGAGPDVPGGIGDVISTADRTRRRLLLLFWRVFDPLARRLAGVAPWWVVLETTGRRSGRPRRTPLARGPVSATQVDVIAVHGRHAAWVMNLMADPAVRIRLRRRWHAGTATVLPYDAEAARSFSGYARLGPTLAGIDPVLVRIELGPASSAPG